MKLLGGLLGIIIVIGLAAFIYLGVSDVHIAQIEVTKPISRSGAQS